MSDDKAWQEARDVAAENYSTYKEGEELTDLALQALSLNSGFKAGADWCRREMEKAPCPECGYLGCKRGRKVCDLQIDELTKERDDLQVDLEVEREKLTQLKIAVNKADEIISERDAYAAAIVRLVEALKEAADVIHSEFCSSEHHRFCINANKQLTADRELIERAKKEIK